MISYQYRLIFCTRQSHRPKPAHQLNLCYVWFGLLQSNGLYGVDVGDQNGFQPGGFGMPSSQYEEPYDEMEDVTTPPFRQNELGVCWQKRVKACKPDLTDWGV